MRRIVLALAGTITVLVLLFSYHTSTNSVAATPAPVSSVGSASSSSSSTTARSSGSSGSDTSSNSSNSSSGSDSSSASDSSSGSGSSATKTITGPEVDTRWGVVQVQITVSGGRVTAADAVQVPSDNPHDVQINSYAVPILNSEAVDAQSAAIDAVSGATVTSDGYISSLQAALDEANL